MGDREHNRKIPNATPLHHPTRRGVGYFGAVRFRDGKFFFRRKTGKFHGATRSILQGSLSRRRGRSRKVVVITGHARYHHARLHRDERERHADKFELDSLPPYSPDLNPIERAWKLTRRQCLHNRYCPLLDQLVDSVETQCKQSSKGNATLCQD